MLQASLKVSSKHDPSCVAIAEKLYFYYVEQFKNIHTNLCPSELIFSMTALVASRVLMVVLTLHLLVLKTKRLCKSDTTLGVTLGICCIVRNKQIKF